jgi:hypothetical protein
VASEAPLAAVSPDDYQRPLSVGLEIGAFDAVLLSRGGVRANFRHLRNPSLSPQILAEQIMKTMALFGFMMWVMGCACGWAIATMHF